MALRWIAQETAALESRLDSVSRFGATIPMTVEAAPPDRALEMADAVVDRSSRLLRRQIRTFRNGLRATPPSCAGLRVAHRRYLILRNRFHALLATVDIFSDALTQRAEHGTGVLLRGLDVLAADGLRMNPPLFHRPPVVCYLDRGVGGAVRRIFTRLPGGERNAVALVRLPRERLCGNGFASLLHEVGHQGSALLRLPEAYAAALLGSSQMPAQVATWWASKISEVLADLWACAKLGVTATLGLLAVLGRDRRSTFQDVAGDPHPMPWIRGQLSIAFGSTTMPHPTWEQLRALWTSLYPPSSAPPEAKQLLSAVGPSLPLVAELVATHRPPGLRGKTLPEALGTSCVAPPALLPNLEATVMSLKAGDGALPRLRPCKALAVVGFARHRGVITPHEEKDILCSVLRRWAKDMTAA